MMKASGLWNENKDTKTIRGFYLKYINQHMRSFIMFKQQDLRNLVKKYFTEANNEQIEILLAELVREIEIMIHAKIRELVNSERIKKLSN